MHLWLNRREFETFYHTDLAYGNAFLQVPFAELDFAACRDCWVHSAADGETIYKETCIHCLPDINLWADYESSSRPE